jgi:hypothetical protein
MASVLGMALAGVLMAMAPAQGGELGPASSRGRTPPGGLDFWYRVSNVTKGKQLYTHGEHEMAMGHAAKAVPYFRQAILLLPTTKQYDALRHRLMMRYGYSMMIAYTQTGDRAFGTDAVKVLERYAERHSQLFGDDRRAKRERNEIYELLGDVELQLEKGVAKPAPVVARAESDTPARVDEGAPLGMDRTVVVPHQRKWKRPSVDDPKIRARLNSVATDAQTGLVLTRPVIAEWTPARGLVRMDGIVKQIEGTMGGERFALHHSARSAFLSVRPALRNCYDQAYARKQTDVVRTEAELVLEPDGTVSAAKIVGAKVIDQQGDTCIAQTLADARITSSAPAERVTVRVPLVFFRQPSILFDEANGYSGVDYQLYGRQRSLNHGAAGGMGPIEGYGFPRVNWRSYQW